MYIVTAFYPQGAVRYGYVNKEASLWALRRIRRENRGISVRWEKFNNEGI